MNGSSLPNRHSIRLPQFDYSQAGAYYITIVIQNRKPYLGSIDNGTMQLNSGGKLVEKWWYEIPRKFSRVEIDSYCIMPDHIHGIINLIDVPFQNIESKGTNLHTDPITDNSGTPLPTIIQWFKTMTTNEYIRGVKQLGWPPFQNRFWQRNYFEHVIRDQNDLDRIRKYIFENPLKWDLDKENQSP